MSQEIIVNVLRGTGHAPVLNNIAGRLVDGSPIVVVGAGGAIPYYTKWFVSRAGVPDIRQGDILVDASNGTQYRASGIPLIRDQSYMKIELTLNAQVTP